jgi:ribulose-bisphosphate carboxylase small chain
MRAGTFSYLPPMAPGELRRQVEFVVARGWSAAIEHAAPPQALAAYWHMWKLPMFGEKNVDRILAEADACRAAHPGELVRLVAYDNVRQTLGTAFIVHHA